MNQLVSHSIEQAKVDTVSMLRNAGENVRNAGKFHILVLSGAHEGSELTVPAGTLTIGSGKDNDIVLFADDIGERHLEMTLPANALKDITLTPLSDAVWLDDASIVDVGQFAEISSGDVFTLGEVDILVKRFGDAKTAGKLGLKVFAILCLFAMLPLVYGLFSNLAVGVASASSSAISAIQHGIDSQTDRILGTDPVSGKGQLDAFAWTTRIKLEDLKLNHRIRVSATATDSLRASGNISDNELGRWTNFLQWYDSNPAFPPLIRDVNRVDLNDGLPKVSSVWLDTNPSVVFDDGSIAGVGDKITDGWEILAIDANAVTVGRDGSVIALSY